MDNESNLNIQKEKLDTLLSGKGGSFFTNTLLAALLAFMLSKKLALDVVSIWFGMVLLINIVRYYISTYFVKQPTNVLKEVHLRILIFRVSLFLMALAWGVSSFLVYGNGVTTGHFEYELVVAYMLAGLSAGAAVTYSIDSPSALITAFVALTPMLTIYLLSGQEILITMGIAGFLYLLFLSVSIKRFNQRLIDGLNLRVEAVKHAEEVKHLAYYDSLTGLPNRRLLLDRLERSFLQNWRTGKRSTLLFIDLDNFKQLNDAKGHDMGDMLLMEVAHRLTETVRESDTVARFGGDEFVVILENLSERHEDAISEVELVTRQILSNLATPYQLVDLEYSSTASIGIAMFVTDGRTRQDLLRHADIAMYAAKQSGRNNYQFYSESQLAKRNAK